MDRQRCILMAKNEGDKDWCIVCDLDFPLGLKWNEDEGNRRCYRILARDYDIVHIETTTIMRRP